MSESNAEGGTLQNYSVDQAAGAVVLVLGAVASLLLVIWQSRCHCKMNLCYIFQCERRPPSEDEMDGLKDQAQKLKDKKQDKKQDKILRKENEILIQEKEIKKKIDRTSREKEPEPEPEPEMEDLL
tara:strand:- start:276 stop:653 length:378 start_codon:yes stop_codon:yes gene_type:complete